MIGRLIDLSSGSNRRILKGMFLVTIFMVIGKVIAAAKEVVVAYEYGVSVYLDIYLLGFVLVLWIPSVLASVIQATLVPLLNSAETDDQTAFSSQLFGVSILVATFLGVALFVLAPYALDLFNSRLDQSNFDLSVTVFRLLVPVAVLQILISLFSAELLAREKHANTLYESLPSLVLLVIVFLFSAGAKDIYVLVIGTVFGYFLQLLCLLLTLIRYQFWAGISFRLNSYLWVEFRRSISVLFLGTLVVSLVIPIDQYLASSLGEGAVSSLSYATKLLILFVGLGVTVVSRSILPVLSSQNYDQLEKANICMVWSFRVFCLGAVGLIVGWPLAPWIVSTLFERGEFGSDSTMIVVDAFRYGLLQLPFLYAGMVLIQFFASTRRQNVIAMSGLVAVIVKILTGFILASSMGLSGITLSTSLMYFATYIFFLYSIRTLDVK